MTKKFDEMKSNSKLFDLQAIDVAISKKVIPQLQMSIEGLECGLGIKVNLLSPGLERKPKLELGNVRNVPKQILFNVSLVNFRDKAL